MNHLTRRTPVAAVRLTVSVAAGINWISRLDSPVARTVKLVTDRSFVNCKVSDFPKDDTGCPKEVDFPEKNADHGGRINCGPVFEGEVNKRYLEYVDELDWDNFLNHVAYFPRKHRSNEEVTLIFDKWAAHHGRKYASAELKEMRFGTFKKGLAFIDEHNSKPLGSFMGVGSRKFDIFRAKYYSRVGHNGSTYWVKEFVIPYFSCTPKWWCELTYKTKCNSLGWNDI